MTKLAFATQTRLGPRIPRARSSSCCRWSTRRRSAWGGRSRYVRAPPGALRFASRRVVERAGGDGRVEPVPARLPGVDLRDAAKFLAIADELYGRAPVLHLSLTGVSQWRRRSSHRRTWREFSPWTSRERAGRCRGAAHRRLAAAWDSAVARPRPEQNRNAGRGSARGVREPLTRGLPRPQVERGRDRTPKIADEYDADSPVATELQKRFGPRAWLSARPRASWPPYREYVA